MKSLRVNHFDSTTSRFRTQIWKIRLDIWRDGNLFFKRSKWTDMDNLSSLWDKGSHQSYHWDLWMHYQMLLLHSLLLHWRRENCVAYLPQVQLRHQKVHNDEMMINPWESLWWIKYLYNFKQNWSLWRIKYNIVSNKKSTISILFYHAKMKLSFNWRHLCLVPNEFTRSTRHMNRLVSAQQKPR